jgi:hypothetical protein
VNTALETRLLWLETSSGTRVPVQGHVSLGRSRTNIVAINCEKVSRRHALIHQDEEGNCLVIDLGSSNGTYVNGARITHMAQLRIGDQIDIGSERFLLRAEDAEQSQDSQTEDPAAAQMVPCWLLIGDKEVPEDVANDPGGSDTYKTIINWSQACRLILERNHASAPAGFEGKVFGYWRDPHREPAIAERVAKTVRELRAVQARQRLEFRMAVHLGTVVVGSTSPGQQKSIIGTEVNLAIHMQRLAWVLASPCLLSEEANRCLAPLLPTHSLEPCGLHGYNGDRQFFSL